MSKIVSLFYKCLTLMMTLLTIYWFLSALAWLGVISQDVLLYISSACALGLGVSYYKFPDVFKKGYQTLMRHKTWLVLVTVIFQVLLLISATMMIRSDAAVVFNGAIKDLKADSIASYLTRNPNNLNLFLYERFFYHLFGTWTVWVLQALNIFYVHFAGFMLYRCGQRFFSQSLADRVFFFYLLLIGLTPKFMAMYTDIMVLPILAMQLYLLFALLDEKAERLSRNGLALGAVTALGLLFRPTAVIAVIACFLVIFLQKKWQKLGLILISFILGLALLYLPAHYYKTHQTEVVKIEGEGLSKNLLTFINLGLTFTGTDQEDMQAGLRAYIAPEQHDVYNNGRFNNDYQIAEIKRRLSEYTPLTFTQHVLFKQFLTTGQGNLDWIYKSAKREKTVYMSPLTVWTEKQGLLQWVRDLFIYKDQPKFRYYNFFIQWVWIGLSFGLMIFFVKFKPTEINYFLSLAVFGGLLFLQIFEGGKSRYLIQFLPQILFVSCLGFERLKRRTK